MGKTAVFVNLTQVFELFGRLKMVVDDNERKGAERDQEDYQQALRQNTL